MTKMMTTTHTQLIAGIANFVLETKADDTNKTMLANSLAYSQRWVGYEINGQWMFAPFTYLVIQGQSLKEWMESGLQKDYGHVRAGSKRIIDLTVPSSEVKRDTPLIEHLHRFVASRHSRLNRRAQLFIVLPMDVTAEPDYRTTAMTQEAQIQMAYVNDAKFDGYDENGWPCWWVLPGDTTRLVSALCKAEYSVSQIIVEPAADMVLGTPGPTDKDYVRLMVVQPYTAEQIQMLREAGLDV